MRMPIKTPMFGMIDKTIKNDLYKLSRKYKTII